MNDLIEVFRMSEVSAEVRARIIVKLGRTINHTYGMNIAEPLVYELVKLLDDNNPILKDEHYIKMSNK